MEVSAQASNPFIGPGGTVTKLSFTTSPIAGISFPPLGETEGESMRRLLFVAAASLVACAGCSSREEFTERCGGVFNPSFTPSYSYSGRAIHAPDGDYSWAESEPKKK
jgi:hypothetical protein